MLIPVLQSQLIPKPGYYFPLYANVQPYGEERIAPVDTLQSNKMVFGNNHAYISHSVVRRTKIKFLPTTFCFLGVFPEICPQKGAQSAIWSALRASQLGSEHRCADTVDSFPSWPFPLLFAQQPLHRTIRPGKDITRSVRAKGALTSPLMRSQALRDERGAL